MSKLVYLTFSSVLAVLFAINTYVCHEEMEECVKLINGNAIIEASGGVKIENVRKIAECGVDIISTSDIVAGAGTLDFGLDDK